MQPEDANKLLYTNVLNLLKSPWCWGVILIVQGFTPPFWATVRPAFCIYLLLFRSMSMKLRY